MQITLSVGDSLASIDTADTSPSIDEVETLARICLEYAIRAHACHTEYEAMNHDE